MNDSELSRSLPRLSDLHARRSASQVETFELSKREHPYIPVSTTKILGKFTRDSPPEFAADALQHRRFQYLRYSETIEELRRWSRNRGNSTAFKIVLSTLFWKDVKVRMPAEQALYDSINYFFPGRPDIRVTICDFGDSEARRKDVRLGELEKGAASATL